MSIASRFEARHTDTLEIGAVSGGVRLDNPFDGRMTDGELEITGRAVSAAMVPREP